MLLIEIRFDQSNKHNTRNKNPNDNLLEKVDDVCPCCPNKISLLPQLCEQCLSSCDIKRENGSMPIFTLTKESKKGHHLFTEPNMQPCTKSESENPICNPSYWPNTAIPQSTKKIPYYKTPSIGHLFNCLRFTDNKNSANTEMVWNDGKTLTLSVLNDIQAGQEIICFRDKKYKQKYTMTLQAIVNAQDETLKRQCSAFQDENERLLKKLKRNAITMCQTHLKNKDLKEFFCEYVSDPTKFTEETGGCFEDLVEYGLEKTFPEGNVFNFHKRSETFNDLIARRLLVQEQKTSLKNMCDMVSSRFTEINKNLHEEFSPREYLDFQIVFRKTKKELEQYFNQKQNINSNSKNLMDQALESLTETILQERQIPDYNCWKYTKDGNQKIDINIDDKDPLFNCSKCEDPKSGFRLRLKTYVCPLTGMEATEYKGLSNLLCMECVQSISNQEYPIIRLPTPIEDFKYMCITTSQDEERYIISFLIGEQFNNYKTATNLEYFYYLTPANTYHYFSGIERRRHLAKIIVCINNLEKTYRQEMAESYRLEDAQQWYHFYLNYIENKKIDLSEEQWPGYKVSYFLTQRAIYEYDRHGTTCDESIAIAYHRYTTAHTSQSIDIVNATLLNFYYKQKDIQKCFEIHTFNSSLYMEEIHKADKFLASSKRHLFMFMMDMYYSTEYSPPTLQMVDKYNIKLLNIYRANSGNNKNEDVDLLHENSGIYLIKRHTFMDELKKSIDWIRNREIILDALKKDCKEDRLYHFNDWYYVMNTVFIQEIA